MKIPTNPAEVAKQFPEVSPERRQALMDHINAVPDGATTVIDQMIANGGPEGKFVAALFNRQQPAKTDAPKNKAMPGKAPRQ